MGVRWYVLSASVLMCLFAGCEQHSPEATHHGPLKGIATAELEQILSVGATTNVVSRALGPPHSVQNTARGFDVWSYQLDLLPAAGPMQGAYIDGVKVYFTNGVVALHAFTYLEQGKGVVDGPRDPFPGYQNAAVRMPRIRLFIISPEPFEGGSPANSLRFPDLGFMRSEPELEFTRVADFTLRNAQTSPAMWTVDIHLASGDAERLKEFTSANLGKKVLILIGSEAVAAPEILAPLATGSMAVTFQGQEMLQAVRRDLEAMKQADRQP